VIPGDLLAAVGWAKVTQVMVGRRKPDNHGFRISRRFNEKQ